MSSVKIEEDNSWTSPMTSPITSSTIPPIWQHISNDEYFYLFTLTLSIILFFSQTLLSKFKT